MIMIKLVGKSDLLGRSQIVIKVYDETCLDLSYGQGSMGGKVESL